ncbi:MAG: glycosyltransferase family 4 protein [Armatimonadetes bacterium]|nr:glycosyltransferase family 4 protein [Armatimonadota bacterium]
MRVAQIAPCHESIPPKAYGGIERVVAYLTRDLQAMGHDVTVFASGDSRIEAPLVPITETSVRASGGPRDPNALHVLAVEKSVDLAHAFDILHFHLEWVHLPVLRRCPWIRHVTTIHGPLDRPDLRSLYDEFDEAPLVSISNSQRRPCPDCNWVGNVYNGIPAPARFSAEPGNYLVFLGRFSPEKGFEDAVEIARRSGWPLKVAAKVDDAHPDYYEEVVRPLLQDPLVECLGEADEEQKFDLLRGARALVFPICWQEPFGLVMTEAMSVGTPVIAYPEGSVPEIVRPGHTGFVVRGVDEAAAAVARVREIDRRECRREFEERFSARAMTESYLEVYRRLLQPQARSVRRASQLQLVRNRSLA